MKLKQLAAGIATGYVTKAVQFVAAMALVPFLLRRDVLGVEDYGRAFTLVAFMGAGTVVTIGVRYSFIRSISKALGSASNAADRSVGNLIGSGTSLLVLLCAAIGVPALIWDAPLLDLVNFPHESGYRIALQLTFVWMTLENAFFLFRVPLMTRGAISYINFVTMAEVVLRTAALFFLLPATELRFTCYFAVHVIFIALRIGSFIGWSVVCAPTDLRGLFHVSAAGIRDTMLYSRSITLSEGASFLVRRAPIVLASRYLPAAEAGLVALVINTIQNYVLQILFAVVQPLALPIAARFDPRRLSERARDFFFDLEGVYCAGVFVAVAQAIVLAPDLIHLWLGEGYGAIVVPAQVVLAGCAIEITYAIRRSLLIGQGFLPEAVSRVVALAAGAFCFSLIGVMVYGRWDLAVFAVGGYLVLSNLMGIGHVWSRHFVQEGQPTPNSLRFASFGLTFVAALIGSRLVVRDGVAGALIAVVSVLAVSVLSIHLLVLPVDRIVSTARRLTRSMDRDLFDS